MILRMSHLKSESTLGPLGGQSVLRPRKHKLSRPLMFTLALTSLIDAFSILVIFLLIQGPSGQKELHLGKNLHLPAVGQLSPMDEGVAVRIEKGRYFVDDREVTPAQLTAKLHEIRQRLMAKKVKNDKSLIVQADKRSDFESINPILQAGAQTGFEQIKFAVIPRKGS
jgi:biopolymer transport protein ExbD